MECVAYMRVSTEKQAEEGNGLDSQKRDIENYCRKNQMIITDWYIDDGYTGANMNRPELQRLINDCTRHRISAVVAFKLDRISRSMVDGIYIIERIFIPNNIVFKCVHDSVSYDSPMEQAYTQMMAVFAQLDKNTMMLRLRGGMLERVKKGFWPGGGNTPYCYSYNKETGILEPIRERAEIARQAMHMYISGASDSRIYETLGFSNEIVVRNILTGVVNIGMIPYKGNVYQGRHEPIFDKDTFYRAQELRKSRRKNRSYSFTPPNLLTGLCYCGVCGCKMRYQDWGGYHVIYCCSNDKHLFYLPNHNPNCTNSHPQAKTVEKIVEDEIIKISMNLSGYKPKAKQTTLEILEKQADKESTRLKRLYDLYADGNDTVFDMIKSCEKKINGLKNDIKEEQKKIKNTQKKTFTYENIKKLADIWDHIDKSKKNAVLKTIIDKVIIVNDDVEIQLKNF